MQQRQKWNIALSFLFVVSLTACGRSPQTTLPDDPTHEGESTLDAPVGNSNNPSSLVNPAKGAEAARVLAKYSYVDPNHAVPDRHLKPALLYYDANKLSLNNAAYLTVIDFSQYSGNKRFHIINMKTGAVWSMRSAHGKNSDPDHDGYATIFSNTSGTEMSSLGVYLTAETYYGGNGYSLRLDGMSSTNFNARIRTIVIHGSNYVKEANVIQGRSWGCPAVAMSNRDQVINLIKNGSLIYAER